MPPSPFAPRLNTRLQAVALACAAALACPAEAAPPRTAPAEQGAAPAASAAVPPGATAEQMYQLALEAQSARAFADMLALLRRSAAGGWLEAQETLGLVLLSGATVYGPAVRADRCEAHRWLHQAALAGSIPALQQLEFLNRARNLPAREHACP